MKDLRNYNLLSHNTFGINAICSRFLEFDSADEAQNMLPEISGQPYIIIGGGSNLLLTQDYAGTVLHSAIRGIEEVKDTANSSLFTLHSSLKLRCGSGETWDDVVAFCVDHDYYGTENLSLIPGDVGASAVQNIGAYGSEVKDLIVEVEAVEIATGKTVIFSNKDCQYAYRQSRFKAEWKNRYFITYVTYQLSRTFNPRLDYGNIRTALDAKGISNPTAKELRETIIEIRQAKLPDPKVLGNGGSFFMNPVVSKAKYESLQAEYPQMPHYHIDDDHEKIPAGWMIDQCGWKGRSLGRAGVHDKQALVLVNLGGAEGREIVELCEAIRNDVKNRFGIDIHPEVNII